MSSRGGSCLGIEISFPVDGETKLTRILLERGARVRLPAAVALKRIHDVERLLREDPDAFKTGCRWANLIVRAAKRSSGIAQKAGLQEVAMILLAAAIG